MHDLLLALGLSLPIAGLGLVVMRPFLARLTRIPEAAWIVLQLGSLSPLFLFLGLSEGIALLPPSTYPLPDLPPLLGEAGLGLTGDKSSARPSFVQS